LSSGSIVFIGCVSLVASGIAEDWSSCIDNSSGYSIPRWLMKPVREAGIQAFRFRAWNEHRHRCAAAANDAAPSKIRRDALLPVEVYSFLKRKAQPLKEICT
jgi:hypothetical protein